MGKQFTERKKNVSELIGRDNLFLIKIVAGVGNSRLHDVNVYQLRQRNYYHKSRESMR